MASIWVESLGRSFEQALDMLAAAVRDCTDELWETPMWQVPALGPDHQFLGSDWKPVTDPEQRSTLAQRWVERRSTPWSVAWHALEVFDYDLSGELGPWAPPPPFSGHPHWRDLPSLPAVWSRSESLGYIDYCRQRVGDTLAGMTEEKAVRPLPPTHRYGGQPHAWLITDLVRHTTEHGSQIRQFITAAGIAPPDKQ
ncbi:MAG: DinB family protein [Dehalococcoidia bacterium]